MSSPTHHGVHCAVVPPFVLESMVLRGDTEVAERARRTLQADQAVRARRERRLGEEVPDTGSAAVAAAREPGPDRTIGDAAGGRDLPGATVRIEGQPPTGDLAVDEAFDGLGDTWTFYQQVFGRDSIDGEGLPLVATVHYGQAYDNAFWNGTQMVFGDGDGTVFARFTASLDVIGHELTHGVTESTAGLVYQDQPGALNESISDVFGSLVRQRALGQTAEEADWLIGAELLLPAVHGVALRSLKAPGTAYDDPVLGRDPQPAHMEHYVHTTADNGGVHINSGIPNHAFYLAASGIGGNAWEGAGLIWWDVLTGPISPRCDFVTFARLTTAAAVTRFGPESPEAVAVASAWDQVGLGDAPPAPEGVDAGLLAGSTSAASAVTELRVRRSGGVTGVQRERTVSLADLPDRDADHWQTVLGSGTLEDAAAQGPDRMPRPDAFTYGISCPGAGVDVEIPESDLPEAVINLIERTLRS